jgi:hypothetical protein
MNRILIGIRIAITIKKIGGDMKRGLILLFFIFSSLLFAVNGELTEQEDRMILRVWGTHYERGEAHGYLLAENIIDLFREYVIQYTFSNNSALYNQAVTLVEANFMFEEEFVLEMEGIISGMQDSEVDLYVEPLSREITLGDLKLINSIIDLAAFMAASNGFQGEFGCSSFASWGEATQDDPVLNGELVVSRLLDWSVHSQLIQNSLLIIHEPAEADEQKWISFAYPSFIGGLTALNEDGIYTELNMGNSSGVGGPPYSAVLFDVRSGIEKADYNGDSVSNKSDIYDAVEDKNHSNGYIIMLCDPLDDTDPVSYLEVNAGGMELRTHADNTEVMGYNIVSTNHFRKLEDPVYCYRYAALANATQETTSYTIESNYTTICSAAGHSGNLMAIQYIPSQDLIRWSNYHNNPAFQEPLISYDITDLFSGVITDSQQDTAPASKLKLMNYPNPFNPDTKISFTLLEAGKVKLEIFNLKGEKITELLDYHMPAGPHNISWNGTDIQGNPVSSGVYFYKMKTNKTSTVKKMILMK